MNNQDQKSDWRNQPFVADRFFFEIVVGVLLVIIAVIAGFVLFTDDVGYRGNLYTTVVGVLITVFVLDRQAERRERIRFKEQLIRELRSDVEQVSKRAAEEIYAQGWVTDGSLEGRELSISNVKNVDWSHARLRDVYFCGANFSYIDLSHADMRNVYLCCEYLPHASLHHANLEGANLNSANLEESIMSRANLRHADLHKASLSKATLEWANLEFSDLSFALCRETMLDKTNMQNSNMFRAQLFDAYMVKADLTGAELCWSHIEAAKLDETTILPDGTRWTPSTDLSRFTNPSHPEFWRSDNPISPAYQGKQ